MILHANNSVTAPSRLSGIPGYDLNTARLHLQMIHDLAAQSGQDGVLVLFGVGENPETKSKVSERALQFRIGDVDGMLTTLRDWEKVKHLNAYAPWAVFRKSLENGKKGSEQDVVAVLAFVADQDADTNK